MISGGIISGAVGSISLFSNCIRVISAKFFLKVKLISLQMGHLIYISFYYPNKFKTQA